MPPSDSSTHRFEFSFGPNPSARRRDPEGRLHLLVLGDFHGNAAVPSATPLAARPVRQLNPDSFEAVCAAFDARLDLPMPWAPGGQVRLQFASLEDFHPDHLLRHTPGLAELFNARQGLNSPSTAAAAAETIQRLLQRPVESQSSAASSEPLASAPPASAESADDTLARLLGRAPSKAPAPSAGVDPQALIRSLVGTASAAPAQPAGLPGLITAVELELTTRLRALLHAPPFQALEAAWRGADFLVRRNPDEERIRIDVLDVASAELAADLPSLERRLRDRSFDLAVGLFTFGAGADDLGVLSSVAGLVAARGAVFLAGAHPQLVGCEDFARDPDPDDWTHPPSPEVAAAWQAFRAGQGCDRTRLALPRFLLRLPYGKGRDTIDGFAFEELAGPRLGAPFLWGNPSLLLALVGAQAFLEGSDAVGGDVDDLPMVHFREAGESEMVPCAEGWLSDRAVERIAGLGLVPIQSVKGSNRVRIASV